MFDRVAERRRGTATPRQYARVFVVYLVGFASLRSFADPLIAAQFPHWSMWKLAFEIIIWIGVAAPMAFLASRIFDIAVKLVTKSRH